MSMQSTDFDVFLRSTRYKFHSRHQNSKQKTYSKSFKKEIVSTNSPNPRMRRLWRQRQHRHRLLLGMLRRAREIKLPRQLLRRNFQRRRRRYRRRNNFRRQRILRSDISSFAFPHGTRSKTKKNPNTLTAIPEFRRKRPRITAIERNKASIASKRSSNSNTCADCAARD